MPISQVLKTIRETNIQFVDLRFTDTRGKEQHMTVSANVVTEDFFRHGKMFDGSSIAGWKDIANSDMMLRPDPTTMMIDPFFEDPTVVMCCDVIDPVTQSGYNRDPRSVARRAEQHLRKLGIADNCMVGPEPEFFLLEDVRWDVNMQHVFFQLDSEEASWNSSKQFTGGNTGHRPRVKGGYFPVPPVDSSHDIRSTMCLYMQKMGLTVETQHHEVAPCQHEINTRYNTLLRKADELMVMKYVVHNVARRYGKTATFMPKPVVGDNGNGMHCHYSLEKNGENLFSGNGYHDLSETAMHFIGGVLHHARALNAFTNPSTNSYKRLVPGFEAPVTLAYSARNRSAAIRIPAVESPKAARIEVRFPDPSANPYLAFAAILQAGIDGIEQKIDPGDALEKNLYHQDLEQYNIVCTDLSEALLALSEDRRFLIEGGVFDDDFIESYMELKWDEVRRLRMTTHPVEFDMYYSV